MQNFVGNQEVVDSAPKYHALRRRRTPTGMNGDQCREHDREEGDSGELQEA
jgi:hypothetical protein